MITKSPHRTRSPSTAVALGAFSHFGREKDDVEEPEDEDSDVEMIDVDNEAGEVPGEKISDLCDIIYVYIYFILILESSI